MGSAAVAIDFVLDDTEGGEVARHRYECDNEGDGRDEGCQQGTADAGAKSEEEGNEGEPTGDWMEDHDASESL